MTTPLSIILVTRNAAPFVRSAVRQASAAAAQADAQVVAVDGGSTDGTWEVLTGQVGWTVRRQQSTGLAAARQEALALAEGGIIAFLDADDVWLPGKLSAQLQVLDQRPEVDVVSCMLQRVASGGATLSPEFATPQPAITPSGCLIRAAAFTRIGGFDPRHGIAADHEWFARARSHGLTLEVLPRVLLHKGIHADNLSHDRAAYRRQLAHVLRSAAAPPAPAAAPGTAAAPPVALAGSPQTDPFRRPAGAAVSPAGVFGG